MSPVVGASATALLQNAAPPAASIHEASTAPLEPLPAQPQPLPVAPELSGQQKSHRGLYMSLGAVIVLAVLVAAGIYVPTGQDQRQRTNEWGTTGKADHPCAGRCNFW